MRGIQRSALRDLPAVTLSPNAHCEKDRGGDESEAKRLNDLLPVLLNVLLPQNGQVDVDIDEERAEESADYTDHDGGRDIQQR